jgi:hypothetical protein
MFFLAPDLPRRQFGMPAAPAERGDEPAVRRELPPPASAVKPTTAAKPAITVTPSKASVTTKPTVVAQPVVIEAVPVDAVPVQAETVPAVEVAPAQTIEAQPVAVVEVPAEQPKASVDTSAADALLESGRALCLKAEKAGSSSLANSLYAQALIPLRKAKAQFVTLSAANPTDQTLKDRLTVCGELIYAAMKNTSYQQK